MTPDGTLHFSEVIPDSSNTASCTEIPTNAAISATCLRDTQSEVQTVRTGEYDVLQHQQASRMGPGQAHHAVSNAQLAGRRASHRWLLMLKTSAITELLGKRRMDSRPARAHGEACRRLPAEAGVVRLLCKDALALACSSEPKGGVASSMQRFV